MTESKKGPCCNDRRVDYPEGLRKSLTGSSQSVVEDAEAISVDGRKEAELLFSFADEAAFDSGSDQGEPLYINIGLDFGTSATKIVVKYPYEPNQPWLVIPAPEHYQTEGKPYLWKTMVWAIPDGPEGQLLPYPAASSRSLDSLKQRLAAWYMPDEHEGRRPPPVKISAGKRGLKVSPEEAVVGYLSYLLRYVKQYLGHHDKNRLANKSLNWRLGIGIPVDHYDFQDGPLLRGYYKIVSLAWALASHDGLKEQSGKWDGMSKDDFIRYVKEQSNMRVVPDVIAASLTGFARPDLMGESPLYLIVDVGAMTLDVSIFGRYEGSFNIFETRVNTLGVDVGRWCQINDWDEWFDTACRTCLRIPIERTRRYRYYRYPDNRAPAVFKKAGPSLPVMLIGGGANYSLHYELITELDPWFEAHVKNGGIDLIDVGRVMKALEASHSNEEDWVAGMDWSRLIVAYGLSGLDIDGSWNLPKDIDDLCSPDGAGRSGGGIDYEVNTTTMMVHGNPTR